MLKAFTPFPCLCLLALLLAVPAMTCAAEAPPAAVPAPQQKLPEAAPVKIGTVDLTRFGAESTMGKVARERVRKKSESLENQMDIRQKQLERQKAALQLKLPTLAANEQEAKLKEFEKKVDEYRKFMQNAEKEMKGFEADQNRQFYQDVVRAATAYGKANGFATIVVKRDPLYVSSGVEEQDVTAEVLKLANGMVEKK